jgi:Lon protease-like protein
MATEPGSDDGASVPTGEAADMRGASQEMAMFPLGSVLLPSMLVSLHVFEDRYRTMVEHVLAAAEPTFGIVLIERGSEVGGGDVRTAIGCTARVLDARAAPDGRWALWCVGEERIRVLRWLAEDPYPRAMVERWPDPVPHDPVDLLRRCDPIQAAVQRVAALSSELGGPALPDPFELDADPVRRSYQLGVAAPLGPLDRLAVLAAADVSARLTLLATLLAEQEELVRARLSFGGD